MSDVYVTFGGETGDLDAALKSVRSSISATADHMRQAGAQFKAAGDSAQNSLGAKLKELSATMSGTSGSIDKDAGKTSGAIGKIKTVFEDVTLGVGTLAAAATAYLVGVGLAADNYGERMKKAAGDSDQSLATVGEMKSVADRAGVSLEGLGKSFTDMQKKAKNGDEATVKALGAIGLAVSDVVGKTDSELTTKFAQAFSSARDSSNKTAAAVALFGESVASKLVPQLDQGAAHMADLMAAAHRTGTALGPEMLASIEGTHSIFQKIGDNLQEFRSALDGAALSFYSTLKPAIDGVLQTFADLTRNVTDLYEWFFKLDGANEKAGASTGMLSSAARSLADAISRLTTYLETMAVEGAEYIARLGVSFEGLSKVAQAFGEDLKSMVSNSTAALYNAFHDAISGVISMFGDLAKAASSAMAFDFSGVGAAFSKFKSDADGIGTKVKAALSPELFSKTEEAWRTMRAGAGAYANELDEIKKNLEAQGKARRDMIWGDGKKADLPKQTKDVSDPTVYPKKAADDNSDEIRAAMVKIEGEIAAVRDGLEQKKALYAEDAKLFLMSESEKIAKTREATEQEYAAEKALLQKELEIEGMKPQQKEQINNKLAALDRKYAADQTQLASQAAEQTVAAWHKMVDTMSSSLSSSIMGMIEHTKKFSDAVRDMAKAIVGQFVQMGVQTLAEWAKGIATKIALNLAGEQSMTAAKAAGSAERGALDMSEAAAGVATKIASVIKSIMASAAEAGAGVAGFLAPVMGPAAIGAGAAAEGAVASMASVAAFDIGAYNMPGDMLSLVHKNELVMPATQAGAFRNLLENGSTDGGNSGDINLHVHATDARSVQELFKNNGRALASTLRDVLNANPSLRPSY